MPSTSSISISTSIQWLCFLQKSSTSWSLWLEWCAESLNHWAVIGGWSVWGWFLLTRLRCKPCTSFCLLRLSAMMLCLYQANSHQLTISRFEMSYCTEGPTNSILLIGKPALEVRYSPRIYKDFDLSALLLDCWWLKTSGCTRTRATRSECDGLKWTDRSLTPSLSSNKATEALPSFHQILKARRYIKPTLHHRVITGST